MKLKIKVKRINKDIEPPKVIKKGEWCDLRAAETVELKAPQATTLKESKRNVNFDSQLIPLGVAMKLPKGFEAVILPRSSTFKSYGILQTNSMGIVDLSYCGDNDEWKLPAVALRDTVINEGDRICQFRIQLSQKATFMQKLKWLFSSGIKIVEVDSLGNDSRGGFGSTGVN